TSWWWLAIAGPHSGTPFDLLATAGTALMTIGACQAAAVLLGRRSWVLAPLSAPGSMPLSVYSARGLPRDHQADDRRGALGGYGNGGRAVVGVRHPRADLRPHPPGVEDIRQPA